MQSELTKCLCGVSDEGACNLNSQISLHRELGWQLIELRSVDGVRVADLPAEQVNRIAVALEENALRVAAICTGIGGWDRTISTPFQRDLDELDRSIECAHTLGTRFLRIMSFPNDGLSPDAWRSESLQRIVTLVNVARRSDVVLLHENCQGWASQGPDETLDMLRQIDSPHLRLLFDTGNPVAYGQNSLSFIHAVAKWVQHVHVKDAVRLKGGEINYTLPGHGQAQVALCIDTLFRWGYQGAFSIEPHCAFIPHLNINSDAVAQRNSYLSYARHFLTLMDDVVNPQRNLL